MKTFLRTMIICGMVLSGIYGIIIVDMRSGEMAGIPPTMEIHLDNVEINQSADSYARGYEFKLIVNNKIIARNLEKIEEAFN